MEEAVVLFKHSETPSGDPPHYYCYIEEHHLKILCVTLIGWTMVGLSAKQKRITLHQQLWTNKIHFTKEN